ncbi:MAG: glutamine--fructose-6-phosphate transaminase (isomerizing), partial [Bdellovibrionota bacterium]
RGYDSTGIAIYQNNEIDIYRSKGKLSFLRDKIKDVALTGTTGIGHTRWATHGKPSDENAHPHRSENFVVVHNGIIENFIELKRRLEKEGFKFTSQTDTEVIPHLIESYTNKGSSIEDALYETLGELKGAFALVLFSRKDPRKIMVAKNASPLILGIGNGENFVASDIPALLSYTKDIIVLEDGQVAIIDNQSYKITDFNRNAIEKKPKHITWSRTVAEKEGYKHFMLKEIYEQPRAITDTLRGRIDENHQRISFDDDAIEKIAKDVNRVVMIACGTSSHAAMVAKYWIEKYAKVPVDVEIASEFRYRDFILDKNSLVITVSQSGETADTLAALEQAKKQGAKSISVCNVIESSIPRKSDVVVYTHAGPEIGVASTKAFTTQMCILACIALELARVKDKINQQDLTRLIGDLVSLPLLIEKTLELDAPIQKIAKKFMNAEHFLYLGRGTAFPIALEGALKLKEISYIHAEGYMGGELKHGPIALIDEDMPIVAMSGQGLIYQKMISNIQEVCARDGKLILVDSEGDSKIDELAEDVITIPKVSEFIEPFIQVIPLQLLSYHIADKRGCDVDQPRNLAKSVTVE